jgi:predicted transposase
LKIIFNGMLQTLMVKLGPSPEQHKMLCETMKRFNEACNHIAETVFALHSANKVEIHKTVYYPVRDQFGLSSQLKEPLELTSASSTLLSILMEKCIPVSRSARPERDLIL